jgi:hypothetical protein
MQGENFKITHYHRPRIKYSSLQFFFIIIIKSYLLNCKHIIIKKNNNFKLVVNNRLYTTKVISSKNVRPPEMHPHLPLFSSALARN